MPFSPGPREHVADERSLIGAGRRIPRLAGLAAAVSAVLALGLVAGAAGSSSGAVSARTGAAPAPPYAIGGGPVVANPTPGDMYELPRTQITFRGIPAAELGAVSVIGSGSGAHTGRIRADADGDGGSFIPDRPFTPGERVTVNTGLNVVGGANGSFQFTIERPGPPLPTKHVPIAPAHDNTDRFRSAPGLRPPTVVVTRDSAPASGGDIFLTPQYGPLQDGPMILDPHGQLVWFRPFPVSRPENGYALNLRVQRLHDQPVLTWWQGRSDGSGGLGEGVIDNEHYRQIATVRAGNGLQMDLHEFLLTNTGDAYILAQAPVRVAGESRPVENCVVQEVEVKTGLVLMQWDALDHIPLADSVHPGPDGTGAFQDPYHCNSISLAPNGDIVVSARNTSAVYEIDRQTGEIVWTLGGSHSSLALGPGVRTAFQHDAVVQPGGDLTIFDDGSGPPRVHEQSRGIEVRINAVARTATLVRQYRHSPPLSAAFEGSMQELPGGQVFLGWGQQPYFSQVDAAGHQDFDAHFKARTASYRAYRFPWRGRPSTRPALAVRAADGDVTAWASWNGATGVAAWRVLAGSSATHLRAIGRFPKRQFETRMTVRAAGAFVAVEALSSSGRVLATSAARRVD